jgi:hypothetical protein
MKELTKKLEDLYNAIDKLEIPKSLVKEKHKEVEFISFKKK